ncbi:polyhomeotic-like protein 2 isoform X3 [Stegostoma tigrinum]|uniref:polyhomeotic-like protein 2 isoform X3 n=1 Tax=Stegostoma tigrinum TaxID=3053191 RepID=UPI00202B4F90|nr:polyhomeotic-like protein 2 isoform X3 [Stegostoma tigrinum]
MESEQNPPPTNTNSSTRPQVPQISVYSSLPERQAVQVIQQALHRQPNTAAQYLQQMYAAQQQHLMLQTAALQQQHLSSAQLQSLAAVQQASLAANRQGSSPNGNVSQQPVSSQTTINLATSPAAAQLISRAQSVNSAAATGIAQQAVLLGNSNSPTLTASQAQMYLRAQMAQQSNLVQVARTLGRAVPLSPQLIFTPTATVAAVQPEVTISPANQQSAAPQVQNLAIRSQQNTAATVQPQLQSVALKATPSVQQASTTSQPKTTGLAPMAATKGGQPENMAESGKKSEIVSSSSTDTRAVSVSPTATPVTTHALITTAYAQIQPHQLMHQQQQQLQLQQQQQKHLQHQFVLQQQQLQHRHQQTQPQQTQLIHTSTQLQPLPAQQPQSVAVQPSAQTQASVHPQAQHCQTVVQQKHQALHLQGAHPPSPVLQPVTQAQQSLQSGSQPNQPDGLLNSHGQTHQTHQHQLAPQTTAVNLQIQPAAHVIQQCQRSSQDIGRREKLDTAVEKGPLEKAAAQTAPQSSTCLITSDQKKTESTKSVTQGKAPESVNVKNTSPAPTMTSGNGNTTSSVTASVPQSTENKPPQAIVKPQILTHVIEGFVIQEGAEPFPQQQQASVQPTEKLPQLNNADSEMDDLSQQDSKEKEEDALKLKCEFCGRLDYAHKFKGSKRFCSMACAKRYNVGCSKRVGLFKPDKSKYLQKKEGGKLGRRGPRKNNLHNANKEQHKKQPKQPPANVGLNQEDSSRGSDNSSYEEPLSPISASSSTSRRRQNERELDIHDMRVREPMGIGHHFLPNDPTKWNVEDVCEFIRSLPGCQEIADEFRAQEIDGQALLLLKEDHLMTAMNIKLGPALKIYARINMLKDS